MTAPRKRWSPDAEPTPSGERVTPSDDPASFPHLFSPVSIGRMELRNRLVMSPMETLYATQDGLPSPRGVAYYEARARGGVGLITLGACTVDDAHREVPNSIDFARDEVLDAHRELTARVHAHGARIQPQIVHPGPDGLAPFLRGIPNLGPSVIPSYLTGIPCRALEADEIPGIVDRFREAAVRVREAGYDGIELHAAHGYMLLGSFLTPNRNRRTDAYAGDREEGRLRLVVEVVRAIKDAAGEDFPLTLRISGYERVPGGRSIGDTQRIAPRLVAAGVDAFHVSGGVIDRLTTQMVTGSHYGPAHNLAAAEALGQVDDVPVIAVGRIHDPALADDILRTGRADLVAMGRPLLADPELPNKAREGRVRELRRCISCESCIDSMETGRTSCAINPFTGREQELAIDRVASPKRVVVVGGGPAGLEAARVAARRGHRVALYERERFLGGALVLAATVHADNEPFLDFLLGEVERTGVEVHLGTELSCDAAAALGPDAVIVATGGRVLTPPLAGRELPHVMTGTELRRLLAGELPAEAEGKLPAWQRFGVRGMVAPLQRFVHPRRLRALLRLWLPFGRRVVVVGGDLAAIELAEFLAGHGRAVRVVAAGVEIAAEVGLKRRNEHMDRLDRLGVAVNTGVGVERITPGGLRLEGGAVVAADSVILAGEVEADTRLHDALKDRVPEVYAIGDCTGLGLLRKATDDGARVGCAI
jgi:2,4-dienoyl-CoA reductase (NADPH2)